MKQINGWQNKLGYLLFYEDEKSKIKKEVFIVKKWCLWGKEVRIVRSYDC